MVKKISIDGNQFELNVHPKDATVVERHFSKYIALDLAIRNLPIPAKPIWLYSIIRLIRMYQRHISPKLGNPCVFNPRCSHYSEAAFRQKGFVKGMKLTLKRLYRCRPKNGGIDELP